MDKKEKKKVLDSLIEIANNDNYKEIFDTLLDSSQDLEIKSHIINPMASTLIEFYSHALSIYGFNKSSELTHYILNTFLKHMISYRRLSRTEILNAISFKPEMNESELSFKEKIIKNSRKL